jgi:hypothetical protein
MMRARGVYLPYEWLEQELRARFDLERLSEEQIDAARGALMTEYCELNHRRVLEEASKSDAADAPGSVVYFAQNTVTSEIKIGTSRKLQSRLKALGKSVSFLVSVPGSFRVEGLMHLRFRKARMHGEWFRPVPELISFTQTLDWGPVPRASYSSLPPLPAAVLTDEDRAMLSDNLPNLFSILNSNDRNNEAVRRRACEEIANVLREYRGASSMSVQGSEDKK